MAYDENLAGRIRDLLDPKLPCEEKKMFGGLCFMIDGKMCIGVMKDKIMLRIHPDDQEKLLKKKGSQPMDFTGRVMKGMIYVSLDGIKTEKNLKAWMDVALAYNKIAQASKKKRRAL
jgi:TfoX/Sxy family transcriptional regulator of competence genes